uniref:Uncharacterized protein n=1 Tax=Steinernema glaseri TaxID=37863 RepID=A0A1I8A3N9_9BILA
MNNRTVPECSTPLLAQLRVTVWPWVAGGAPTEPKTLSVTRLIDRKTTSEILRRKRKRRRRRRRTATNKREAVKGGAEKEKRVSPSVSEEENSAESRRDIHAATTEPANGIGGEVASEALTLTLFDLRAREVKGVRSMAR